MQAVREPLQLVALPRAIGIGIATRVVLALLQQRGMRYKRREREDGSVVLAAKKGAANKLGYFCAHIALVVICIGGLLDGNPGQLGVQILGVVATLVYSGVVSFIILKVLDLVMGLRPDEHTEAQGLDITAHGERAYVQDGAD